MNGQKILVVRGKYSYQAPDGNIYLVMYVADQNGYRAVTDPLKEHHSNSFEAPLNLIVRRINPSLVASLTGGAG